MIEHSPGSWSDYADAGAMSKACGIQPMTACSQHCRGSLSNQVYQSVAGAEFIRLSRHHLLHAFLDGVSHQKHDLSGLLVFHPFVARALLFPVTREEQTHSETHPYRSRCPRP
jgi:hypothetical protein